MDSSEYSPAPSVPTVAGDPLPTLTAAKAQAQRLRESLSSEELAVSHSQALELVARQHGYRDWNALHAAIGNRPPESFVPGGRLRGHYLGQAFSGTVLAVERLRPGWFRLELDLDEAVDVVTFASFSNFRKRIRGTVGPYGASRDRTGKGLPVLDIDL